MNTSWTPHLAGALGGAYPRSLIVSFRQACGVSLVRRYLRPEVTTPTRFYPEDRAARLFLPCSIRLISSLENFSGS